MTGPGRRFIGWLLPVALLAAMPLPAQEEATGVLTEEYFVRQGPEEPLVIRVAPFEAEFRVAVTGPDDGVTAFIAFLKLFD